MYLIACGALLATGIILNTTDRRMLALTLAVGANIFLPIPNDTAALFYGCCIAAELAVAVIAFSLRNTAGLLVFEVCALLVVTHLMGYVLDGNPPFSPYRAIVKILEVSQLVVCLALSPKLAPILRNHDVETT